MAYNFLGVDILNPAMLLIHKSEVNYLVSDCTVRQALEKFKAHSFTAVPLLNRDGVYLGTIRDKDFLFYILNCGNSDLRLMEDVPITDILTPDFNPPVQIDTDMETVFKQVMEQNFVPVVDSRGHFVGIITRKAMLSKIYNHHRKKDLIENDIK